MGPAEDVVEVSVFGRGIGESILAHLGHDVWVVVDSCVDPVSGEPAALKYLADIGRSPDTCVHLIVVTHWHDDHVRGLARTIRACARAVVGLSSALGQSEFLYLLELMRRIEPRSSSGVSELIQVFDVLREEGRKWKLCAADTLLLRSPCDPDTVQVYSLSPTDEMVMRAVGSLASVTAGRHKRGVGIPSANHASVALWLRVGAVAALLGADLEESNGASWTKVAESSAVPTVPAELFKVPHHGSITGHCDLVWDRLLVDQPESVVTEFTRLPVPLPTPTDIARLAARSARLFVTSSIGPRRPRFRDRVVDDMFSQSVATAQRLPIQLGHVRARRSPAEDSGGWEIQLSGAAIQAA